jgi:hypothetical protein
LAPFPLETLSKTFSEVPISTVLFYTLFYIVMKLRYRDRILWQPAIYLFVSFFTWSGATYFFLNKSSTWVEMLARSRHLNMDCRLLHFYDNHDIWHFLSAAVLRDKILVF